MKLRNMPNKCIIFVSKKDDIKKNLASHQPSQT